MRLLVDGLAFATRDYNVGIQRYYRELLGRISKLAQIDIYFDSPPAAATPEGCRVARRIERWPTHRLNLPARAWRKFRRRAWPTRFSGHDLFHSTFFTRSPEAGTREVLTIQDMIPECYPGYHSEGMEAYIQRKKECIMSATRIICASHATAADVSRLYPACVSKLRVVHHGADHMNAQQLHVLCRNPAGSSPPYVLYVGRRENYKNFSVVSEAIAQEAWPREVELVVVGPDFAPDELEQLNRLSVLNRIRHLGRVDDLRLRELYNQSLGLIFPSLIEGFGFPVCEAQLIGTVVVCSDIRCFREVAGDGAIYFNPSDPAAVASAVSRLLDPATSAAIRDRAAINVRRFSWDRCAELTMQVYNEALGPTA